MTRQEDQEAKGGRGYKMKIEKIDGEDKKVKFIVEDTSPSMMNAVRRISMNHIPVLAIEDVGIIQNSSPVFDETIAQRLGQVPLVFDSEKFDVKENCDCEEGCSNCEAKFTLKGQGPGKIYSGDLTCETGDVEILYDKIPIAELDDDQEVELEATAIISTGKDHSKHQAAISSYQYYPIIDIDNEELTKKQKKKCVEVCPREVLEIKNDKLKVKDEMKCTLCKECTEEVGSGIVVAGDEEKFIFKVESICSLDPKEVLEKTAEILEEKVERVIEKLS